MKYTMGLSILYGPFFFLGHFIALATNFPADGFSLPYQYTVFGGSILYTLIGIWALSRILMHFFDVKVAIMTMVIIVFATNYLLHVTMDGQNTMSQNFLFTTYSLIIWFNIQWHETQKLKHIILMGILCGITILSRPSEIVCLLIPIFWNVHNQESARIKIKTIWRYKNHILLFIGILILFASFQILYWKKYTGEYLFYSYGANAGEGFNFFHPQILNVLFSFRKGWLIYTPIMLLAISGFYSIYVKNRSIFYSLFIYFLVNLYVVSSWSCWWYAQSFSQRALIPSYPIMAVGLGYFLTSIGNQEIYLRRIVLSVVTGLIVLNIFQTIQFKTGVLNGDRMTRPYYFRVFGRLDAREEDKKLLLINRSFDGIERFENEEEYQPKLLKTLNFNEQQKNDTIPAFSSSFFTLDSSVSFSPAIDIPYYQMTDKDHAWVRITAHVYPSQEVPSNPFSLVVHFNHKDAPYKYRIFKAEEMKLDLNEWNKITIDYLTPEVRSKWDNLKVYFWHQGNKPIYVDDLQVHIFEKIK